MAGDTQIGIRVGSDNPLTKQLPTESSRSLQIPAEFFQQYDKMIDPSAMFLSDLMRTCCACQLFYDGQMHADSPLPGYKLVPMTDEDGNKIHANMTREGANTISGLFIFGCSRAISSTNWHEKHSVEDFALDETMGIVDQITSNADHWKLGDDELIYTLSIPIYKNFVAIGRRSHKGGFLDVIKMMVAPRPVMDEKEPVYSKWSKWIGGKV